MIDRNARDRLAAKLEDLIEGRITTDAYFAESFDSPLDGAISQILEFSLGLFHDLYPYRLRKFKTEDPDWVCFEMAKRAVLFLRDDKEYGWPDWPKMKFGCWANFLALLLVVLFFANWISVSFCISLPFFLARITSIIALLVVEEHCYNSLNKKYWQFASQKIWPYIRHENYEFAKRKER